MPLIGSDPYRGSWEPKPTSPNQERNMLATITLSAEDQESLIRAHLKSNKFAIVGDFPTLEAITVQCEPLKPGRRAKRKPKDAPPVQDSGDAGDTK